MVKLPNPFGRKDKEAMDFQKAVVGTEVAKPDVDGMTSEYVNSLGRTVYGLIDANVLNLLVANGLEFFIPTFSQLNRLTQLQKADMPIAKLDLEAVFLEFEAMRDEGDYDAAQAMLIENLQFHAGFILTDAFEGFKAKVMAYQVKMIKTELEEKKTKGLFG